MNQETESLLRQFIPEARDLLEQAGRSLLALERKPGDAELLNELFRAVHTLKGTSGLFAIEALTRLVHAGEDVLFAVQAGQLTLTPDIADALLESLDQVGLWIESLSEASTLPAGAQAVSEKWVGRLRAILGDGSSPGNAAENLVAAPAILPTWLHGLSCEPAGSGIELLAIRYAPDAHCFFRGEDPLGLFRQIQGIRALQLDPVEPWPSIADVDPFLCNICLRAIVDTPRAEVEHLLRYALDQVEIVALPAEWPESVPLSFAHAPGGNEVDEVVSRILDGQRRLLQADCRSEVRAGHRASATRALRGLLSYIAREDLAANLEQASATDRDERFARDRGVDCFCSSGDDLVWIRIA